jgi:SAM-dependent methyltransferase
MSRRRIRRIVPARARRLLRRRIGSAWPPVGWVRFGSLRRVTPLSRSFGFDRGKPVDRYYIEDFLRRHAYVEGYAVGDIRGRVLEIGNDMYAREFGGYGSSGPVERVDILSVDQGNSEAALVADLSSGEGVPKEAFDCVICTQTLQFIYDVRSAIETIHSALRPGGVVLATVPGISPAWSPDRDLWGDYWRFTSLAVRRLFEEVFPPQNVTVEGYGNVLATTAFLHGLAAEDLRHEELQPRDPDYELLVAVRAVKPE